MLVRSQNFGQMSSHRVFIEENLLHLVTVRNKPLGCCFPAVKQLLRVSGSPESTYPPIASFCPGNVLWLRAHLPTEDQNLMKKLILHLEISSAILTSLWSTVDFKHWAFYISFNCYSAFHNFNNILSWQQNKVNHFLCLPVPKHLLLIPHYSCWLW